MSEAPVQRRRLDQPDPEEESARRGCMTAGAVLGIVVGIAIVLFAVPPLLDHFFGEPTVALGETYEGDAKVVALLGVTGTPATGFEARFAITTNKTWAPRPEDFELELSEGPRLRALPPDTALPATSLAFPLAEERELALRFPPVQRADARPVALYLKDPRVRFALEHEE